MEVRRFGLYVFGNLAIVRILGASGFLKVPAALGF